MGIYRLQFKYVDFVQFSYAFFLGRWSFPSRTLIELIKWGDNEWRVEERETIVHIDERELWELTMRFLLGHK